MDRQDTYERTYSQLLPANLRPSTEDDYAIACALAQSEQEAKQHQESALITRLDGALALQLHEHEANKLLHPPSKRSKTDSTLRKLLHSLNVTKVVPRLNPCFFPDADYVSQDRQRLLLRLDMYALQERQVTGDGNCQFRAIADQLYGDQQRHAQVRQQVVDQLCSHPERYRDYVTTDYQQYVSSISQPGTWGDHVTLQAAANACNVQICVLSSFLDSCVISIHPCQSQQQQESAGEKPVSRIVWLAFWAEVHYNSLAAKAPASPSASLSDSSPTSSTDTADNSRRLLGSKKLGKAAAILF